MMRIFYINLARRTDRRAFMEEQFARLGLAASRIEAVTPADLEPEDIERWCNPRRVLWLTPGELCCSVSHLRALEAFLASGDAWAAIFEDDAVLSTRLPAFLDAFDTAPPAADLVRIETALRHLTLQSGGEPVGGMRLARYVGWEPGGAGYLVSRQAAAAITASNEMRRRPVDRALFHWSSPLFRRLAVRQTDRGLCIQARSHAGATELHSDLTDRRQRHAAERPYAARHLLYRSLLILNRDVFLAAWKAWHRFVLGAERRRVEFAAD